MNEEIKLPAGGTGSCLKDNLNLLSYNTELQKLKAVFQRVVIIPLRGYIDNSDYSKAKTPYTYGWNKKNYKGLAPEEAEKHLEKNGWLGLRIPEGHVLVDVDSKQAGSFLGFVLDRMKIKRVMMETPHGFQFVFKDTGKVQRQQAKMLTKGLFIVDYRLVGRGYTVIPSNNTEGREWIQIEEPDSLPFYLEPLKTAKQEDEIQLPIPEGSRNDTLFRHISRLRDFMKDEEEIKKTAEFVNNYIFRKPLSEEELKTIIEKRKGYNYTAKEEAEESKKEIMVVPRFYPRPFTEELTKKFEFWSTYKDKGNFYYYDAEEGIWKEFAEEFISYYLRSAASCLRVEQQREYIVNEIIKDVREKAWRKGDQLPEPSLTLIPFVNGVYDVEKEEFRDYRAEDYFTWKVLHRYNPDAKSRLLKKVIDDLLPEGDPTLWELMAYTLWRQYNYEKFFVLFGRGSNGKSTFAEILENLVGRDNVSHVPLEEIRSKSFEAGTLYRKLANIATELEYSDLNDTNFLKALVGKDAIQAKRKFKGPIKFTNYAKLIFLTNEIPTTRDTTDAFYRRVFLVKFQRVFKDDPVISQEISFADEEEYEALLYLSLQKLMKLKENKFVFTRHTGKEEVRQEYEKLSSPLRQFVEEECIVTRNEDDYIAKYDFRDCFSEWLKKKGRNAYTDVRLKREIQRLGIEEARKSFGEKRYRSWTGIRRKVEKG